MSVENDNLLERLFAQQDIAETLLKTIYILPDMADQLKKPQQAT